jgi:hypothetical protein
MGEKRCATPLLTHISGLLIPGGKKEWENFLPLLDAGQKIYFEI